MRLRLRYSRRAKEDIAQIYLFVYARSESGAERLLDAIERTTRSLPDTPGIGHPHHSRLPKLQGLRITTVTPYRNYLIAFRVTTHTLDIIRVSQGSRDLDRFFDDLQIEFEGDA